MNSINVLNVHFLV